MPYLPNERQYRNFAATNFRALERNDESDDSSYIVTGHFTVFDSEYELFPGFYETVDRHALDDTDMSDTLFQFNHGGMVLARRRNDSLQVGVDADGGWARADLSGCQQGRDLYEAISNGLIDRMSFGFTIADEGVEWDEDEDGSIHSRITHIDKLYDVSAVDLPASEYTDISARSYADGIIETRNKVIEKAEAERKAAEDAAEAERIAAQEAEEERVRQESIARRKRRALALKLTQI